MDETIAIITAIYLCKIAGYNIVGSDVVDFEHNNIHSDRLQMAIKIFYNNTINKHIILTAKDRKRAVALQAKGLGKIDSAHLAAAEIAKARFLLTTDEDFQRICAKKKLSKVKVINPINFLQEVKEWAQ